MQERRKFKRPLLLYYNRIFEAITKDQLGNLVEITPEGFSLVSEKSLPAGEDYHFLLELTNEIAEKPYLEFYAHSVWCREDVDATHFNTGFRITRLNPDDVEIINRIIDMYALKDR